MTLWPVSMCKQGGYAEPSLPSVRFRMLVTTEWDECRVNLARYDRRVSKTLANLVRGINFKMSPLSRSKDQISLIGGLSLQHSQATELRVPSKLIRDGDTKQRQPSFFVLTSWGSLGSSPRNLPEIFDSLLPLLMGFNGSPRSNSCWVNIGSSFNNAHSKACLDCRCALLPDFFTRCPSTSLRLQT